MAKPDLADKLVPFASWLVALDGEYIRRSGMKGRARHQGRSREVGLIRRIREVLGFQAEGRGSTAHRHIRIRRRRRRLGHIELQAWLIGEDLNVTSAHRVAHLGYCCGSFVLSQDEVIVVPAVGNRFADGMRLTEVEWSTFYRFNRPRRYALCIKRGVLVGVDASNIVEDRG